MTTTNVIGILLVGSLLFIAQLFSDREWAQGPPTRLFLAVTLTIGYLAAAISMHRLNDLEKTVKALSPPSETRRDYQHQREPRE